MEVNSLNFKDLDPWKQKLLYLVEEGIMTATAASRELGVSERTARDVAHKNRGKYSREEIAQALHYDDFTNSDEITALTPAKILFYDIETAPSVSYHFGQWKQNLSDKQRIFDGHMLSHAWAWNDGDIHGSILTPQQSIQRDPRELVEEAWKLFDEADIIVAHFGRGFDVPTMNGYFLKYGLQPPSPYKVIDTKFIASKKFRLAFNSLRYLAAYLGCTLKIENSGIDLWVKCAQGVQEALDEMLDYNIGDVETLREVYGKLIGWSNDGVNLSLYDDHNALCTHCGSDKIVAQEGKFVYTAQRKYQAYRCTSCGANLRGNRMVGTGNTLLRVV